MSKFEDDLEAWQVSGTDGGQPLGLPRPAVWLRGAAVTIAESANWLLHASMYSLANPIGSDVFIVDALGLPAIPLISDLSVGNLINGTMALGAVGVPVVAWFFLFTKQDILKSRRKFFRDPLAKLVAALLILMYLLVVATEFSALWLRIAAESHTGPIPNMSAHATGTWPLVIMSIAVVVTNLGIGAATANVYRAIKDARSPA
ncbi:MAG: hypothetical protein H6868_00090 [Rhodospirillales bacterium]|nr:hypothetical protein [Rhodospirillales bacterium]